MALLDFMKQGTQWLTDNTGMDWNTVQRDPGLAAKRLMGAPVDLNSQYQAQTQDNLLGTPENIVVDPAMQNRVTYNNPEFTPDYRTVQNTSSLDDLYGNNNGWDRNRREPQALDFSNRETYQNSPQNKEQYQAGMEDGLYKNYPTLGFTEVAPGLRASDLIKGGYSQVDLLNAEIQRKFEEEQNAIAKAKQDAINLKANPQQNMTASEAKETSWLDALKWNDDSNGAAMVEYFTDGGDRDSVVNLDQSYKTNEFDPNDGASGNPGEQGVFDTVVNYGRGIFTPEGEASDSKDQTLANTAPKERDAYLKLRQDEKTAIQIDALDVPDARKIELYKKKGIPIPDKYGMKGLLTGK